MATLTSSPHAYAVDSTTGFALSPVQNLMALVGRLLIAMLFLPAGWAKVTGFAGTVGYIASKGLPMPEVCAVLAIAAEVGLSLLLIAGWQTRWAALGLAFYVIVLTPLFHNYWAVPEAQVMVQKLFFFKNYALVGGLLALAAFGGGAFSIDGRRRTG